MFGFFCCRNIQSRRICLRDIKLLLNDCIQTEKLFLFVHFLSADSPSCRIENADIFFFHIICETAAKRDFLSDNQLFRFYRRLTAIRLKIEEQACGFVKIIGDKCISVLDFKGNFFIFTGEGV